MNLRDKVVIVTGAKSGIGLATAMRFGNEGAKVVVADVQDARPEVSEMVRQGADARFVQTDVRSGSQVADLMEKTSATYGRLDILVNNAGI